MSAARSDDSGPCRTSSRSWYTIALFLVAALFLPAAAFADACCLGATCIDVTREVCAREMGKYLDGEDCTPNPCGGEGITIMVARHRDRLETARERLQKSSNVLELPLQCRRGQITGEKQKVRLDGRGLVHHRLHEFMVEAMPPVQP